MGVVVGIGSQNPRPVSAKNADTRAGHPRALRWAKGWASPHFIRAETIRWDQLLESGSEANARAKGTLRLEGKDYIVQDGDVMHIRHSG
jgi:hypothetical protein